MIKRCSVKSKWPVLFRYASTLKKYLHLKRNRLNVPLCVAVLLVCVRHSESVLDANLLEVLVKLTKKLMSVVTADLLDGKSSLLF